MSELLDNARKLYPFRELKYLYSDMKKPEAVVIKIDDFLGVMETLQIESDKEFMRSIKRGLHDAKKGRVLTHKEVFG